MHKRIKKRKIKDVRVHQTSFSVFIISQGTKKKKKILNIENSNDRGDSKYVMRYQD